MMRYHSHGLPRALGLLSSTMKNVIMMNAAATVMTRTTASPARLHARLGLVLNANELAISVEEQGDMLGLCANQHGLRVNPLE